MEANPVLLDAHRFLMVTVPTELAGDIMGDLNCRRFRSSNNQRTDDNTQTINADIPMSELYGYCTDLLDDRGLGDFSLYLQPRRAGKS